MPRPLFAALLALVLATPAAAEDRAAVELGLGVARLSANELVFEGPDTVSRLVWTSRVPVLSAELRHDLPAGWTFAGRLVGAIGENSDMTDYDWIPPFATGNGPDDWSDRSRHPGTELRRFIDLDVTLGRQVALLGETRIGLHGGLKYTEDSWRARGGSFVFSEDGFRDTVGDIPDGLAVIDYLQRHKTVFAGVDAARQVDRWTFSGHLRAGLSLEPRAVDHHWLRYLRFDDEMETQPYLALTVAGAYALGPRTSLGLEAGWQRFDRRRGDGRISEIGRGPDFWLLPDAAGADLTTATLSMSLASRF